MQQAVTAVADTNRGFIDSVFLSRLEGPAAIFKALFWIRFPEQGAPLSMLCAAPFVALAYVALFRPRLRTGIDRPLVWLIGLYVVILLGMSGKYLLSVGAGYDMRHAITLWPFAILVAAPLLDDLVQRRRLGWLGWRIALVATAAIVFNAGLNHWAHAAGRNLTPNGTYSDPVVTFLWGGLLVGAALLAALLARRWIPASRRDVLVAAAIGMGLAFQLTIKLGVTEGPGLAPFSARYVEKSSRILAWWLFGRSYWY